MFRSSGVVTEVTKCQCNSLFTILSSPVCLCWVLVVSIRDDDGSASVGRNIVSADRRWIADIDTPLVG